MARWKRRGSAGGVPVLGATRQLADSGFLVARPQSIRGRRLDYRAAEHGDVPPSLPVAGFLRPRAPSRGTIRGSGAAGPDGGDDGQFDRRRALDGTDRGARADADWIACRTDRLVVVLGFRIRADAARCHARHAANRPWCRFDLAASSGRINEHGRTRAIRYGRRHCVHDAIPRRRGWHDDARRPPARSVESLIASAAAVCLCGRADPRRGAVAAFAEMGKSGTGSNCASRNCSLSPISLLSLQNRFV